jgi:hypothetical protein
MYLRRLPKLPSKSAPRLGHGIALDPGGNGVGLREKLPDFDSEVKRIGKTAGEANLVEAGHQIDRPQVRISLQHSQLFVPADGAYLGNIEPALE